MKKTIFLAAGLIIIIATVLIIMVSRDSQPSTIEVANGQLVISGSFGTSVPLDGIENIDLTETAPVVAKKTNGAGIGTVYKGEFELQDNKPARLYMDASKPPFLVFTCDNVNYCINLGTSAETDALYQKIVAELNK